MAEHKFKLTKQLCELAFKSWNLIVVQSWNASNQFKRVKYVNVYIKFRLYGNRNMLHHLRGVTQEESTFLFGLYPA